MSGRFFLLSLRGTSTFPQFVYLFVVPPVSFGRLVPPPLPAVVPLPDRHEVLTRMLCRWIGRFFVRAVWLNIKRRAAGAQFDFRLLARHATWIVLNVVGIRAESSEEQGATAEKNMTPTDPFFTGIVLIVGVYLI